MSAEQGVTDVPVATGSGSADQGSDFGADHDGQGGAAGGGLSKSSRRRRRKRKGKGSEAGGAEGASGAGEAGGDGAAEGQGGISLQGEAFVPRTPSASPQPGRPPQGQAHQGQQNGNAPGGTKRWKKKFRERRDGQPGQSQGQGAQGGQGFRGPDTHQPGNGGGFKRKQYGKQQGGGRQGGSRSGFVGPMDHSYRAVNGNVFDGSTIEAHAGGGGRSARYQSDAQPIDYSQGRAVPIAPGTPTRIYFFIEDLFFTAKISETARKLGVKVAFVKNEKEQLAALTSGEEETRPALIVFDLNNANAKPMTLIPKLRTKLKKTASIVGFLSTLQGELRAKAVEAGCDSVMPRAAFSQNLPNLLRRYGLEEVEETQNFNQ